MVKESWLRRCYQGWNLFWFTPADPTLLGLIRIGTGIITLYTFIAYSFELQNFLGPRAWLDLDSRLEMVRNKPVLCTPLSGNESPLPEPSNAREKSYLEAYRSEFGVSPPGPYPRNDEEMNYCHQFRKRFGFDLRMYGLPPPLNESQKDYLEEFAQTFRAPPAPPYPTTDKEAQEIVDFMDKHGADLHRLLSRGLPIFSLWFHVTDPEEMHRLHIAFMVLAFLFLIGFCTRLTSALTWFASLNYIHRAPEVLFGADTMMNILLLYLMIGPSGAALSVDRLLKRWWHRRQTPGQDPSAAGFQETPQPLVGANLAMRLLQVHVCIIYFVAGIAKLQGNCWWNGSAVWGTIANFEYAPMQFDSYNQVLFWMCRHEFLLNLFLFIGTYFTLAFEIAYPFLIWRPSFRWLILASAILLHGFIGVLMGLKTFALIMLVMNMAFLRDAEAHWMVNRFTRRRVPAKILLIGIMLFLSGSPGFSQEKYRPLPMSGTAVPELAAFDQAMQKFMGERQIPAGTLAVMKQGRIVLQRGFGHADRERTRLLGPDAPLRLASISKPITAAAILQLVRTGKIKLDTRVFLFLGLLPAQDKSFDPRLADITVQHLLEHKGGWDRKRGPYFDPMFQQEKIARALGKEIPVGPQDIIRFMMGQKLHDDPGTKYTYANFGYCVLGRVIEKASGRSYIEHINQEVLGPLGIQSMDLGKSLPKDRHPREPFYADSAKGRNLFSKEENTVPTPDGTFYLESLDAHGGLIGSAPDLVRFMQAYRIDGQPRAAGSPARGVFYGGLPGTWTMILYHRDVNIAILFNQRTDPSGLPYDTLAELMKRTADSIQIWPGEE